jgi:hypothetical protein
MRVHFGIWTEDSACRFGMQRKRPALFKGRHLEAEIIILCVRWYLRYPLSLRQLEEIMASGI